MFSINKYDGGNIKHREEPCCVARLKVMRERKIVSCMK